MGESWTNVFVIDAVAGRVPRAGCCGMKFSALENRKGGKRIVGYRTSDGIAGRWIGFLSKSRLDPRCAGRRYMALAGCE